MDNNEPSQDRGEDETWPTQEEAVCRPEPAKRGRPRKVQQTYDFRVSVSVYAVPCRFGEAAEIAETIKALQASVGEKMVSSVKIESIDP